MPARTDTSIAGLVFRPAAPADVPQIIAFIRELAAYEKLLDQVTVDEALLHAELFGPRPIAEAMIAELDGAAVGYALYFHNLSTFLGRKGLYVEDLYVTPRARRRGVGRQLMYYLAKVAAERGCGRFEWAVLDWNTPAVEFYRSLGATAMDEWTVQRVTGPALTALGARFDKKPG
jgi:GNAT superfamily N-acetyltransferase